MSEAHPVDLLLSHGLASFSDRLWDFAFPLIAARVAPKDAFFIAALYALTGQCATFFFSGCLGRLMDQSTNRLNAMTVALLVQNVSTVGLSLALLFLTRISLSAFYCTIALLSASSSLSSASSNILVTHEWTPLLMDHRAESARVAFNGHLRQVGCSFFRVSYCAQPQCRDKIGIPISKDLRTPRCKCCGASDANICVTHLCLWVECCIVYWRNSSVA